LVPKDVFGKRWNKLVSPTRNDTRKCHSLEDVELKSGSYRKIEKRGYLEFRISLFFTTDFSHGLRFAVLS